MFISTKSRQVIPFSGTAFSADFEFKLPQKLQIFDAGNLIQRSISIRSNKMISDDINSSVQNIIKEYFYNF